MIGMQDSLLVLQSSNEYKIHECLKGTDPQIIAFDPQNPSRAYCSTFGDGLWKTDDSGQTWNRIGKDVISSHYVTSVSVSPLDCRNKFNKVYVGTEPSTLYISNDGGESWERMSALNIYHHLHHGVFLQGLGLIMCVGLNQMKITLTMFLLP
jgi:hypothetical protein